MNRTTLWGTVAGGVLMAMGLLIAASGTALGEGVETRMAALLFVSLGAMVVAVFLYIDARRVQARNSGPRGNPPISALF